MKPYLKLLICIAAVLSIAAVGNIYYEVLPGLQIKHPITGATTATINGTNGTVTAGFFVGDGSGLTGLPSGSAIVGTLVTNGASTTAGALVKFGNRLTNVVDASSSDIQSAICDTNKFWIDPTDGSVISTGTFTAESFIATGTGPVVATNIYMPIMTGSRLLMLNSSQYQTNVNHTAITKGDGSAAVAGVDYQSGVGSYSVGTLGSGSYTGQQRLCTDAVTPSGTSELVEWDGSNWRLARSRIVATSDWWQFIAYAHTALWDGQDNYWFGHFCAIGGLLTAGNWAATSSGTGANAGTTYDSSGRAASSLSMGTADLSYGAVSHFPVAIGASNSTSISIYWRTPAAPDGTDNWWGCVALNSSISDKMITTSVGLYYDRWQILGYGNDNTNNWYLRCIAGVNSTNIDTGVSYTTGPNLFRVTLQGQTEARVYIGGTCVATNADPAILPAIGSTLRPMAKVQRAAGSTSRSANVLWAHLLHENARAWPQ